MCIVIETFPVKYEFLDIEFFKIVPAKIIQANAKRADILNLATDLPEYSHTIGTAKFLTEEKDSTAGPYFENQFQFSFPSYINDSQLSEIKKAGAILLYADTGRILVLYQNDVFSNGKLKSSIKSNDEITEVEFQIQTIQHL